VSSTGIICANRPIVEMPGMTPQMAQDAMAFYDDVIDKAWREVHRRADAGDDYCIGRLEGNRYWGCPLTWSGDRHVNWLKRVSCDSLRRVTVYAGIGEKAWNRAQGGYFFRLLQIQEYSTAGAFLLQYRSQRIASVSVCPACGTGFPPR